MNNDRILPQTRDVIDRLRHAGLKRGEFRARCERIVRDRIFVGYGDVHITLFCSIQRQRELAPELAKYFHIIQYTNREGRIIHLSIEDGMPGITVTIQED